MTIADRDPRFRSLAAWPDNPTSPTDTAMTSQSPARQASVQHPAPTTPPLGAIDDLIKYRIVELLLAQPRGGDATAIARSLGFHSVDLTAAALDELVGAGICDEDRESGTTVYRLAAGALTFAEIRQVRLSRVGGRSNAELYRSLAISSLKRARARATRRPATDLSGRRRPIRK